MRRYRTAVQQPVQAAARPFTFAAPIRGLVLTENLAVAGPAGAQVLDNWFPTQTGIRARGGCLKYATISEGPVTSMFTWQEAGVEQFFAADQTNIFNISSVADSGVIPATPVVTGQTSGYYSTAQIANTDGDNFSVIVNGTDDALLYDGITFEPLNALSTPAFTGVETSKLSFVWSYASRLFFIESGTLNAWFLDVDSFAGTANRINLAGVFKKGGFLVLGGTWSMDAGDGLDDRCVFVSSEGEIAVFEGILPGEPGGFSKVGVYQTSAPMGINATMQAGGDFIIAQEDGMVPLSQSVVKDPSLLSLASITKFIKPAWDSAVNTFGSLPWHVVKWPKQSMALVAVPTDGNEPYCFALNFETGAWTKFTGWDTRSLCIWQDQAYFGTSDGKIMAADVGGNDDGLPYTCTFVGLFESLGTPGFEKVVHQARSVFLSGADALPKVSVSTNYQVRLPAAPNSIPNYITDTWDSGLWDQAVWDAGEVLSVKTKWVDIGRTGFSVAPQVQVTFGITPKPRLEFVAMDITFEIGGFVVG